MIGQHNKAGSSVTNSGTHFHSKNKAFVIGNGNSETPSDAFSVDFEGNVEVYGRLKLEGGSEIHFKDEFGQPQSIKLSQILDILDILNDKDRLKDYYNTKYNV